MFFSYFYDPTKGIQTTRPTETIGIEWYLHLIKDNPFKSVIERLRTYEKGTEEYKNTKLKLPFGTLNAVIGERKCNDDIARMSGGIYLDIDADKIEQAGYTVHELKQIIIEKFNPTICHISVGGRGICILQKYNQEINSRQFYNVYDYVVESCFKQLKDMKLFDVKVRTPSMGCFISYDKDVYYNSENSIDIPEEILLKPNCRRPYSNSITIGGAFHPIKKVFNELAFKTPDVDTDGQDVIHIPEGLIVVNCFYHRNAIIKDDTKHNHFPVIVQKLFYLNNDRFEDKQYMYELIVSYINWINQRNTGGKKMAKKELIYVVSSAFNKCLQYGITIELDKQYYFSNPELPTSERSGKVLSRVRKDMKAKNKEIIEMAVNHLGSNVTPKRIMEFLTELNVEMKLRTVERYYKEYTANSNRISRIENTERTAEVDSLYSSSITIGGLLSTKEQSAQAKKAHTLSTIQRLRKKFLDAA